MFYVKMNDITTEITPENVFATCPVCGAEHSVNLSRILKNELSDLTNTDILCKQCTEKPPIAEGSLEEDNCPGVKDTVEENSKDDVCDIMRKKLVKNLGRLEELFEKDLSPEDTVMVSTEIRKIYRDFWSY